MSDPSTSTPQGWRAAVTASLRDLRALEPAEQRAALASFAFFFCVLCSYYIIRPLRDEMGVTVGTDGLQRLFVIVFVVMLAAVPVFGWLVSRLPRPRVAPAVYAFFAANLLAFWGALSKGGISPALAATFFVWVSVFNLFVVSLFWIVMSDLWSSDQAKRLYGLIAAGGSAGAFCGPLVTQSLVHVLSPTNLLLVSAGVLGLAGLLAAILAARAPRMPHDAPHAPTALRDVLAGATHVVRSPFLLKIAAWVLLANLISTFFYFEQARVVGSVLTERSDRVQLFARMDLASNILTVAGQIFVTGALLQRLGVGLAAAAVPAVAIAGLAALAISPTLWVLVVIIVAERAVGFAFSNPAMRVLYTVVSPEEKYKAQSFIDTVVFRGGDAASGWLLNGVAKTLGAATATVALLTLPFAAAWLLVSLVLGRAHQRLADPTHEPAHAAAPDGTPAQP